MIEGPQLQLAHQPSANFVYNYQIGVANDPGQFYLDLPRDFVRRYIYVGIYPVAWGDLNWQWVGSVVFELAGQTVFEFPFWNKNQSGATDFFFGPAFWSTGIAGVQSWQIAPRSGTQVFLHPLKVTIAADRVRFKTNYYRLGATTTDWFMGCLSENTLLTA